MASDDLSLGERIKRRRNRRSLTQEELAEKAGISVDVIRELEQEVRTPPA